MPDPRLSILIVDDSKIIRDLLSDYLREMGHRVDLAVDGQEGIEKALAGEFEVVFCDLHMPRRNGYQVFREVSRAKPNITFIMTDSLPDQLAVTAAAAGACYCLTKPFDLDQVCRTLDSVLAEGKTPCPKPSTKTSR